MVVFPGRRLSGNWRQVSAVRQAADGTVTVERTTTPALSKSHSQKVPVNIHNWSSPPESALCEAAAYHDHHLLSSELSELQSQYRQS